MLNRSSITLPAFHCGTIANPVHRMEVEHDEAGEALRGVRLLTDDYTPPEWACNTYRALLDALLTFEQDMHQHIHKENNVLFPRATAFPGFQNFLSLDSFLSTYIGIKLLLLLGTLALAVHARFSIIPNLTKETLNSLAYHIVGASLQFTKNYPEMNISTRLSRIESCVNIGRLTLLSLL